MTFRFKKPLFWTNVFAFIFAGWLIAGLAFGWTNPGSPAPGGGGAISVDSSGRVGVGKTNPNINSKIDIQGSVALTGQRVFDLSGGALTIGDMDSGDGLIGSLRFRANDANIVTVDPGGITSAGNIVASTGFVRGQQLCIGGDCRSGWPASSGSYGFGGIYGYINSGANCSGNPYTGGCSCPAGYNAVNFVGADPGAGGRGVPCGYRQRSICWYYWCMKP